jgi:hypothetical protein
LIEGYSSWQNGGVEQNAVIFVCLERRSMLNRLKILLEQPEYSALIHLAEKELRTPADQVRLIVRLELIRRGMLPEVEIQSTPTQENFVRHESTC